MSILRVFIETKCEGCNGTKPKNTAFCKACYYALPHKLRSPLWHRFSEGFEEAYAAALNWLKPVETAK